MPQWNHVTSETRVVQNVPLPQHLSKTPSPPQVYLKHKVCRQPEHRRRQPQKRHRWHYRADISHYSRGEREIRRWCGWEWIFKISVNVKAEWLYGKVDSRSRERGHTLRRLSMIALSQVLMRRRQASCWTAKDWRWATPRSQRNQMRVAKYVHFSSGFQPKALPGFHVLHPSARHPAVSSTRVSIHSIPN